MDELKALEERIERLRRAPRTHRHQIEANEKWLELGRGCASADEITRRIEDAGLTLAVARAEWLDRYAGLERLYWALDDEEKGKSASICVERVNQAAVAEFLETARVARAEAEPIQERAAEARSMIGGLAIAAVLAHVEGDEVLRASLQLEVKRRWDALARADPEISWQWIVAYPPYRRRLPLDDEALAELGRWVEEARAGAPDIPEGATPEAEPGAAATATATATATAAPGRFSPDTAAPDLALFAGAARAHAHSMAQPIAESHYGAVRRLFDSELTGTERELELARRDEIFSVESTWYDVLLRLVLQPLRAAALWEADKNEAARVTARESERAARRLFGSSSRDHLTNPGLKSFLAILCEYGEGAGTPGDATAYLGESGLSLIADLRGARQRAATAGRHFESPEEIQAFVASLPDEPRFTTPEEMRDHFCALLDQACADADLEKERPARGLFFWDRPLDWVDLRRALREPPRPGAVLSFYRDEEAD